jgi:hypothetical protein
MAACDMKPSTRAWTTVPATIHLLLLLFLRGAATTQWHHDHRHHHQQQPHGSSSSSSGGGGGGPVHLPGSALRFTFEPEKYTVWFNQTHDQCSGRDTPDQALAAFRRRDGTVVALSGDDSPGGFFAMVGSSLASGQLRRDCEAPVLRGGNRSSPHFSDPSAFPHATWLSAVWTGDGQTVHGLVHDEFHGDVSANNGTSHCPGTCWYTTVLQALSTDGGRSFRYATSPGNPRAIAISSPVGYRSGAGELTQPPHRAGPARWLHLRPRQLQ